MGNSIPYSSVRDNFLSGVPLGTDFLDEKIWNTLSIGAQEAIFGLSQVSREYFDTAIYMASKDVNFIPNWKIYTLSSLKRYIRDTELADGDEDPLVSLSTIL